MKFFTKNELVGVGVILSIIIAVSLYNFRIAIRRARDAQRRADLGAIVDALDKYNSDFGFFPPAFAGKIKACKSETFDKDLAKISAKAVFDLKEYFEILAPCEWGEDSLRDLSDEFYPAYLETIPEDAKSEGGGSYLYFSNPKRFQIYAYLEGEEVEEGFNAAIVARQIHCGLKICNFGKAYGETPLDKSLEEYENELLEKIQKSPASPSEAGRAK